MFGCVDWVHIKQQSAVRLVIMCECVQVLGIVYIYIGGGGGGGGGCTVRGRKSDGQRDM